MKKTALLVMVLLNLPCFCQNNFQIAINRGHFDNVNSVKFSHNGKMFVTCGGDNTIKIWTKEGKLIKSFPNNAFGWMEGSSKPAHDVEFSYDDNSIFTLTTTEVIDQRFKKWSLNGRFLKNNPLDENVQTQTKVYNSKNKLWAEVASWDKKVIYIYNKTDAFYEKEFKTGINNIETLAWSNDGNYLAAYCFNRNNKSDITIWNKKWEKISHFQLTLPYQLQNHSFAFAGDNKHIIAGNEIYTFDGKLVKRINIPLRYEGPQRMAVSKDGTIYIWANFGNQNLIYYDTISNTIKYPGLIDNPMSIGIFPGTDYFFTIGTANYEQELDEWYNYENIKLWSFDGYLVKNIYGKATTDFKHIVSCKGNTIFYTDFNGKIIKTFHSYFKPQRYYFSNDESKIITYFSDGIKSLVSVWNIETGNETKIKIDEGTDRIDISYNDQRITLDGSQNFYLLDIDGRIIRKFKKNIKDHDWYYLSYQNNYIEHRYDGKDKKGNYIAAFRYYDLNGNMLSMKPEDSEDVKIHSYTFNNNSSKCNYQVQLYGPSYASHGAYRAIEIYKDGNKIKTFDGFTDSPISYCISNDCNYLAVVFIGGYIKIYNMNTWNSITMVSNEDNWIAYDDEGYFDGSRYGSDLISVTNKNISYAMDQFAFKFNRPDILLKKMGNKNNLLIEHYYNQYKKRLKKASLTEEALFSEINIPTSTIVSSKQDGKFLEINFQFDDAKFNLQSYNIFINDVPFFGSYGKSITGNNFEGTEKIELTNGSNKIEISCINKKGAESYRAITYADYNEISKTDLYYLGFGVSNYKNPNLNLSYAHKDALDLEKVVQSLKGKGFENIYTKVLTNEQVTPEAIKASKDFVKNAKPDDTFILFIAGHGMHDKDAEATYYYLTSNADINNLKGTAADFETIEDLLQGIPPRNKLFLMDACESGEIDEETYETLTGSQTLSGLGIASRGFKATSAPSTVNAQPSAKRTYLYQKDRYIYNDLVRRSGAIVFSSSKGGELSYERSDIENGLFTEYIMKALTTTEADKDSNGIVSTDELRQYVSEQVAQASGDLQHPTVDRDNIYQKLGFQIK